MPMFPRMQDDDLLIADHILGTEAFIRGEPRYAPSAKSQAAYEDFDAWSTGWSTMWTRCYAQGVKAAIEARFSTADGFIAAPPCPYVEDSPAWEAWLQGLHQAEHL